MFALPDLLQFWNMLIYMFVSVVVSAANGMYMGSQEMRLVVERDNATVRQHLSKVMITRHLNSEYEW